MISKNDRERKHLFPAVRRAAALVLGVAWLTTMLILGGCSSSEKETSKAPVPLPAASQEKGEASISLEKQPDTVTPPPQEEKTKTTESSPVTIPVPPSGPLVEKIPGYKVSAEYLTLPSKHFSQNITAVSLPLDYEKNPDKSYPLVIVFGGAGECAKSPREGALAWMRYYKTDEAVVALASNHLDTNHFRGLVTPGHLRDFNRKLSARPYKGVILACPASPLISGQRGPEFPEYEAFVIDELIPELKRRYRVADRSIGVDGVSMGGSRSMYYGFKYPEIFSSVGAVQGAFGPFMDIYRDLVTWNSGTLRKRQIQLITSDKDVMAPSVQKLHQMLVANKIPHSYLNLSGPHDYIFNQGPGALALLMFHDQALR
ncbi:MAG: hypothetical protein HY912_01045 [Desulfomonile tiedjei]|uniref:Enterochelin esterase-like enzyme n=1 Tax=Desulfomonile tiedjei TaxID=2358 RepID=A0A9D6Z1T7_9BACT|nr:hypothetical protein [Desulfomonile tiedjei]